MTLSNKAKIWIFSITGGVFILFLSLFLTLGYQRIDAGHVGIKVNLYGTQKGVQDITEVSGAVWYGKITTVVYEFPTFIQNKEYTLAETKESKNNQEFRVSTRDGSKAAFDVSINYQIRPDKVTSIFKNYRKGLEELEETIIYNYLREAFNKAAGRFTCDELYGNRERFKQTADSILRAKLEPDGFDIKQIVILGDIRFPKSINDAIEAKIKAKETATKKQEELVSAEADAKKRIADANGRAEAAKIAARGRAEAIKIEAEANSKLQQSLSPQILQKMWIDKWNGQLPSTMSGDNDLLMQIQ